MGRARVATRERPEAGRDRAARWGRQPKALAPPVFQLSRGPGCWSRPVDLPHAQPRLPGHSLAEDAASHQPLQHPPPLRPLSLDPPTSLSSHSLTPGSACHSPGRTGPLTDASLERLCPPGPRAREEGAACAVRAPAGDVPVESRRACADAPAARPSHPRLQPSAFRAIKLFVSPRAGPSVLAVGRVEGSRPGGLRRPLDPGPLSRPMASGSRL